MSIEALMVLTATVTPRTVSGRDALNDEQLVEGPPFTTSCWMARVSDTERQIPDNVEVGDRHFYFPADITIDAMAKVTVDGEDFELVGEPWFCRNPRSSSGEHIEAYGRRVV